MPAEQVSDRRADSAGASLIVTMPDVPTILEIMGMANPGGGITTRRNRFSAHQIGFVSQSDAVMLPPGGQRQHSLL